MGHYNVETNDLMTNDPMNDKDVTTTKKKS
jgi:hypothetical protein